MFSYKMPTVNLDKHLEYMYGLERFGIKLGLKVMQALMAELGNPHREFPSVHITGTNGKGSTAAMLESVVRAGGYATALYTSPHLFTFNERIRVNNIPISDAELGRLISQVRDAAAAASVTPTFFEFTTAVAFCYFAQHKPNLAVIEVGMGGLLDATNVVTPLVSVITNIGLDHTPLLGKTRLEIAANKAGIIKQGVPVVTGDKDPAIIRYLRSVCQGKSTYVRSIVEELVTESTVRTFQSQKFKIRTKQTPGVSSGLMSHLDEEVLTLPLLGLHQLDNAATAVTVLDELVKQGIELSVESVRQGFAATKWPGRIDLITERPFVLVDGAHNSQSWRALYSFLTDAVTKPPSYDVLVIGVKNDKDISDLREVLVPLFDHIIVTEGAYEPMPATQLAAELSSRSKSMEIIRDSKEAARRGLNLIGATGSLVITGSLYMIPEALTCLHERLPALRGTGETFIYLSSQSL